MKKSRFLAVISVLALVMAACGGAESDSPSTPDDATPTTSAGAVDNAGEGNTTDPGDTQTEEPAPGSQNLPFESGTGYFEVDGVRFEPAYIVRCVPFSATSSGPHEDDLDLRGHRLQDGIGLEVTVSVDDLVAPTDSDPGYTAMRIDVFLHRSGADGIEQYAGSAVNHPDGSWYDTEDLIPRMLVAGGAEPTGPPLAAPAGFEIGDGSIRGTMTLPQEYPVETGTVDVTFDYTIPSEEFDCDQL
jgi:hypothetical protein